MLEQELESDVPAFDSDLESKIRAHLDQTNVYIVDPSGSSRQRLAGVVQELGARGSRLKLFNRCEDAEAGIQVERPGVVIADFQLGGRSGLDLLQSCRKNLPTPNDEDTSAFILVTADASQTAVARAAEEDIDGFILKPYTLASLKISLMHSLTRKVFPTGYYSKIREAKRLLHSQQLDEALIGFRQATRFDPKPSLAHYYVGETSRVKKMIEQAQFAFEAGLRLNRIHYKCLVGLYELLEAEGRLTEAYEIIRKLSGYFPANPKRLGTAIRLAIATGNVYDVEGYFKTFQEIEPRTDELVRYACSGLITLGIRAFQDRRTDKAVEALKQAAVTAAGNSRYLLRIIEILVSANHCEEIPGVLARFAPGDQCGSEYKVARFLFLNATGSDNDVLVYGRSLLSQGLRSPVIYNALIALHNRLGFHDEASRLSDEWTRQAR